jgi:hypothetical protein
LRWRPDEGLPLLKEAAAPERRMPLAYACLARTRAINAFESGAQIDRAGMEQALKDLTVANGVVTRCPFLGLVNLEVQMYAAFACEAEAETEADAKRAESLREKAKGHWADAKAEGEAAGWGHRAINHRRILAEREGGAEAGLKATERDWKEYQAKYASPPNAYASALYQVGKVKEALALLERFPSDELNNHRARGYLLAETSGPAAAAALYDQLEAQYAHSPVALIYIQDVLLVAGCADRAAANARKFRTQDPWKGLKWTDDQTRTLQFLAGELKADEFAAKAVGRRNQCTAYYLIGLKALAGGDRTGAKAAFDMAEATRSFLRYGYRWAINFRTRLKADDTWPAWVK